MLKPKRIAWDACMWIAAIQRERIVMPDGTVDDRDMLCRAVLTQAMERKVEIATSALSLIEVCKVPPEMVGPTDLLFDFFRHDWVLMVNVDTQVGQIGRALMMAGYPGLKPADATHLASALVAGVLEFQTFDERLLALDGLIDKPLGGRLAIRRPATLGDDLPLLDGLLLRSPPLNLSSEAKGPDPRAV